MLRKKRVPPVTVVLVILNILVFFLVEWQNARYGTSDIYRNFIMVSYAGRVDTVWHKMITSMFLHADFNHLIHNMIGLAMFGYVLENAIGHIRFFAGYMISGFVGNAVSLIVYAMNGEESYMLGASGAVCGIIGMSLIYGLFCYIRREPTEIDHRAVAFSLVYTIYYGFSVSNVNNTAHIAGAVAGVFFGLIFLTFPSKRQRLSGGYNIWPEYLITLLLTLVIIFGSIRVFSIRYPQVAKEIDVYMTQLKSSFDGWSFDKLSKGEYAEDIYSLVSRKSMIQGNWKITGAGTNRDYASDSKALARGIVLLRDFHEGKVISVDGYTIKCGNREFTCEFGDTYITLKEEGREDQKILVARSGSQAQVQVNNGEFLIDLELMEE